MEDTYCNPGLPVFFFIVCLTSTVIDFMEIIETGR